MVVTYVMNQFTKRDKTILVIFVLLHILISSIARAAGINMATSISFGFFTVLYLVYIFFSQKGKSSTEMKTESVKAKIFKFDSKLLLILLVLFVGGFGFYWYELRPSQIKKSCFDIAQEKAIKEDNLLNNRFYIETYNNLYKMCLEKKGL